MSSESCRAARWLARALALCLVTAPALAIAQGFAAYVSPPRVLMQMQPGQTQRQVIEIQHAGNQPGRYRFYTVDWSLSANGTVEFSQELVPQSCRPMIDATNSPRGTYPCCPAKSATSNSSCSIRSDPML